MSSHSSRFRAARFQHWLAALVLCGLVSLPGCTSVDMSSDLPSDMRDPASPDPPAAPDDLPDGKQVRWDGAGVLLGETDSLAYTAESFLQTVANMLEEERVASIHDLVTLFPDIALQALQESSGRSGNPQALRMIASQFDSLWCSQPMWQPWLDDLQQLPVSGKERMDIRDRFWRYLKNHQPEGALKLRLTRTIQREHGSMLRIEFHRLESIAHMMSGNHDKSIEHLEQSIELARGSCPYLASKLQLLLGEFYRHAGNWDEWKSTWQDAVVTNSQLLSTHDSLDPQFWNRAAYLRPAGMEWPETAIANLNKMLTEQDLAGTEHSLRLTSDESVVWFAMGARHLKRGEGQNAVLAFKKAEAVEKRQHSIAALRLHQARAMVSAGQPGAASAILYQLAAEHEETMLADRCKSILGVMKLQNGSVTQGRNLIQASLASIESWPRDERLRTQADYALALLVQGHEQEGLRRLAEAQADFLSAGDLEQARQCLWNRARYFEKTGQKDELREARSELLELESTIRR